MSEEKLQSLFCILEREQAKLLSFIRLLLAGNAEDALDVLQKTNERILRAAEKADLSQDVPAWFRKIALREVQRHFRDRRRARVIFDSGKMDSLLERIADDAEEDLLFRGEGLERYLQALRHCVQEEDSTSRAMLEERYFRGKKNAQIAKEHALSRASVALFLFRVRQSLRKCIEKSIKRPEAKTSLSQDISLLLDGELSPEREEALLQRLATDAHCRREYITLAMLHGTLAGEISPSAAKTKRRWLRAAAATLLCALTALGMALLLSPKENAPSSGKRATQTLQGKETQMTTQRQIATVAAVALASIAMAHSERSNAIALDTRNAAPAQDASSIDTRNTASDTSKPVKLNTTKPLGTVVYLQ